MGAGPQCFHRVPCGGRPSTRPAYVGPVDHSGTLATPQDPTRRSATRILGGGARKDCSVDDELADLLAAGERAAFHGRPAAGLVPLKKAVEVASSMGQPAEATAAAWLLGVCLGAAGRYGSALSVLEPVANGSAASAPERRLFAALACATVASVHRQLGRHSVARAYDEQGLTLADGADEATFDCVLGLAADAVGLAESAIAQKHLDEAAARTDGHPEW